MKYNRMFVRRYRFLVVFAYPGETSDLLSAIADSIPVAS